jgi:hypothetical protein
VPGVCPLISPIIIKPAGTITIRQSSRNSFMLSNTPEVW